MVSKRGAENIRKFNEERTERNYALVEQELQLCRKRKLQFRSPGLLAAYLSDRTGIHRTTLTRNLKYKALVAVYMRSQPGAAFAVGDNTEDPWILKAKLATTQSEVGMLRQEVRKLSAQLTQMTSDPHRTMEPDKSGVDFANICVLLCLVLSKAETFAVDVRKKALIDLASRPSESFVAGPDRVNAFMAWMDQNAALPFVKSIKRV